MFVLYLPSFIVAVWVAQQWQRAPRSWWPQHDKLLAQPQLGLQRSLCSLQLLSIPQWSTSYYLITERKELQEGPQHEQWNVTSASNLLARRITGSHPAPREKACSLTAFSGCGRWRNICWPALTNYYGPLLLSSDIGCTLFSKGKICLPLGQWRPYQSLTQLWHHAQSPGSWGDVWTFLHMVQMWLLLAWKPINKQTKIQVFCSSESLFHTPPTNIVP